MRQRGRGYPVEMARPIGRCDRGDFEAAAAAIRAGKWRESAQAKDWVGRPIADALGFDLDNRGEKAKVVGLIKVWMKAGSLSVVEEVDDWKVRKFVRVSGDD